MRTLTLRLSGFAACAIALALLGELATAAHAQAPGPAPPDQTTPPGTAPGTSPPATSPDPTTPGTPPPVLSFEEEVRTTLHESEELNRNQSGM